MAFKSNNYRKFVAASATATLVATAVSPALAAPTSAAASFTDVSDRYKEAVDYLVDHKITIGITPTKYGTQENIKRVDVAVMLAKAVLTEGQIADAKSSGFTDVPARAKLYVDALKEQGIVNGKTATSFGADASITRGEAALMLAKAYNIEGNVDNVKFTDVSSRYKAAVAALVDNGITTGKLNNRFGTADPITRGELAIFLHRLEMLVKDTKAPVLNYNGEKTINVENGAEFPLPEVTATDDKDKEVKVTYVIKDAEGKEVQAIDTKVAGTYTITYTATDKAGNKAEELVITVKVGEAAAVAPTVTEVKAVNDTTIEVTFDGKLTADQVKDLAFTFDPALKVEKVELKEDASTKGEAAEKTTVVLTTEKQKEGTAYQLTAVNGAELEAPIKVEAPEVVAPVVESIKEITTTDVTVTFDKAFGTAGEQTITLVKGDKEYEAKANVAADATTVTFKFTTALTEDGVYTVKGTDVKATLTAFSNAAAVKAVNEATNQVQLLDALKNNVFKNINADLIAAYRNVLGAGTPAKATVAEVQKAVDTVNAVTAVNAATTEVQLLAALKAGAENGVFTGVREEYISTYANGIINNDVKETAAQIQAVITNAAEAVVTNAVNALTTAEGAPTDANLAAARTAVNAVPADLVDADGKNVLEGLKKRLADVTVVNAVQAADAVSQVRLLAALKENNFARVNDDLIVQYATAITPSTLTVKAIQAAIDAGNLEAATTKVTALSNASTEAQFNEASALLKNLAPDAEGQTTVADLNATFNLQKALAQVGTLNANSTATQINAALTALDKASEDFDATTIAPELRTRIATDIGTAFTANPASVNTVAEIQDIVVNAALGNIADLTAQSSDAQVLAALRALANVSTLDAEIINPNLAAQYKTALVDFTATGNPANDLTTVNDAVVTVNDPSAVLNSIAGASNPTDAELLTLLNNEVLALKNVANANVAAYQTNLESIKAAIDSANTNDEPGIQVDEAGAARTALVEAINEINNLVDANAASSATALRTVLNRVAVQEGLTDYIDLNSTAKLEVAAAVLADRPTNGYTSTTALTTAVTNEVTDRTTLFTNAAGVNLGSISQVRTALTQYELKAFTDLGAATQVEVAEYLVANRPAVVTAENGAYVSGGYTTIAQIEAAIAAAQK
ncbi:hypothetical protein AC623_18175 [Bacillus sp. FJAT-27231]|uniref:S-layer homology domain-containing protein n=1 Tax=Bacillus sp. FJAT-27231 TaxID=1679168 RepID=UPI000670C77C|nr:S-layer homology domain-containing protein [Bacillus sp. FJAT-27231]KMY55618.1 hypothetical protein AC623_18175 [Bacillus sp. FJAT-27231]